MRRAVALALFLFAVVVASAVPARASQGGRGVGVEEGDCGQLVVVVFEHRIGDYDNVWCGPPPE